MVGPSCKSTDLRLSGRRDRIAGSSSKLLTFSEGCSTYFNNLCFRARGVQAYSSPEASSTSCPVPSSSRRSCGGVEYGKESGVWKSNAADLDSGVSGVDVLLCSIRL